MAAHLLEIQQQGGNIQACSSGILRQNMLEFLLVILVRVQIIVMRWKIPECCPVFVWGFSEFFYCVDQINVYLTLVGHFADTFRTSFEMKTFLTLISGEKRKKTQGPRNRATSATIKSGFLQIIIGLSQKGCLTGYR